MNRIHGVIEPPLLNQLNTGSIGRYPNHCRHSFCAVCVINFHRFFFYLYLSFLQPYVIFHIYICPNDTAPLQFPMLDALFAYLISIFLLYALAVYSIRIRVARNNR